MKYSISSSYSRSVYITLIIFILVLFLGYIFSSENTDITSINRFLLFHPIAILITGFFMLFLLVETWRYHRDHIILLPLSTFIFCLYCIQALIGILTITSNFPDFITTLHRFTAILFLASFSFFVISVGLFSDNSPKAYPIISPRRRIKDYFILSKPIIILLLLLTTFAGSVIGGGGFPSAKLAFWTLLAGGLTASGAGAINQYIDRDLDKLMQRTANRPLAAGRMLPAEGLAFGLSTCFVGIYLFAVFVNFLSAALALAGIFYYVVLYSIFLKKSSIYNIVIGGGAGAIPPLVGWAAVTGSLDITAWILYTIIFFWTPPHFWALSIVRKKDYALVGIPMLPVIRGEKETRKQILIYTIGLVIFTLIVPIISISGGIYFLSSLILGIILIFSAFRLNRIKGEKAAWQMYRISSIYLALIFFALVVDTVL